jgi:hypothetical protein
VILLLTCLFNSLIVQSLSTINHEVTTYFPQISTPEVSLCALVFMLIHPFNTFLANYILDSYSLKLGVLSAHILDYHQLCHCDSRHAIEDTDFCVLCLGDFGEWGGGTRQYIRVVCSSEVCRCVVPALQCRWLLM